MENLNLETIKQTLRDRVSELYVADDTVPIHTVTKTISDTLKNISSVTDYRIETIKQLWDTWSWKQKLVWFWRNEITGEAHRLRQFYFDVFIAVTNITPDVHLDFYHSIKLPYWAVETPKSIYITSVSIQPSMPLECINISFTI